MERFRLGQTLGDLGLKVHRQVDESEAHVLFRELRVAERTAVVGGQSLAVRVRGFLAPGRFRRSFGLGFLWYRAAAAADAGVDDRRVDVGDQAA